MAAGFLPDGRFDRDAWTDEWRFLMAPWNDQKGNRFDWQNPLPPFEHRAPYDRPPYILVMAVRAVITPTCDRYEDGDGWR
jgi:hypothetical protein